MPKVSKEVRGGVKEVVDATRCVDGDGKMVGSDKRERCVVTVFLEGKGWRTGLVEVVCVVEGYLMEVVMKVAGLLKEGEVLHPGECGVPLVRGEVVNLNNPDVLSKLRERERVVDGALGVRGMKVIANVRVEVMIDLFLILME